MVLQIEAQLEAQAYAAQNGKLPFKQMLLSEDGVELLKVVKVRLDLFPFN